MDDETLVRYPKVHRLPHRYYIRNATHLTQLRLDGAAPLALLCNVGFWLETERLHHEGPAPTAPTPSPISFGLLESWKTSRVGASIWSTLSRTISPLSCFFFFLFTLVGFPIFLTFSSSPLSSLESSWMVFSIETGEKKIWCLLTMSWWFKNGRLS